MATDPAEATIPFRRRALYAGLAAQYWFEGVAYRCGWRSTDGELPHAIKRRVLRRYARDFGLRVLVETGTYLGDMMVAMAGHFDELHTIELSEMLHRRARLRLAGHGNVRLHQGDSGAQIARVLEIIDRPALFWLDAHYSGGGTARAELDTPINEELRLVLAHPVRGHVVLIDDARIFTNANGYPTVQAIKEYVRQTRPDLAVAVENDIIRITPVAARA
jgi:hypothetical protein